MNDMKARMKMTSAVWAIVGCGILCGCSNGKRQGQEATATTKTVIEAADTVPTQRRTFRDTITELPYDIPAQRFDETAQQLVHATGCFIESDLSKTGGVRVNPVRGRMSLLEAVSTAIEGTGLRITEERGDRIKVELITKQ